MLPARHRLRTAAQFQEVLRGRSGEVRCRSARAGGALLVVHAAALSQSAAGDHAHSTDLADAREGSLPPRVGFVVSKAVGNAVARNRVKRRLRHLVYPRLAMLPADLGLVLRAQRAAADATFAELDAELERLLTRVLRSLR